jgi:hypothetical protein
MPATPQAGLNASRTVASREMFAALDTARVAREMLAALDTGKMVREMHAALDTARFAREILAALNTGEIVRTAQASFRRRGVSASSTQAQILEMLPEVVSAIVEDELDALRADEVSSEFTTYKLDDFLNVPMQMLLIAVVWFLTFRVVATFAMSFPDISTEVRTVTGSSAVWLADKASKFVKALLEKLAEDADQAGSDDK